MSGLKLDATVAASILASAGISGADIEEVPHLGLALRVAPHQSRDALGALRDSSHAFAFMADLFGVDTGENIDVVYHLRSLVRDEDVRVKVSYDYGSELISVWDLFPMAAYPERECAEMFGLTLSGNPNPKYLLLTAGTPPLLLKSVEIRGAEEVRNR